MLWPLMRAFARRIEGRGESRPSGRDRTTRARVSEVEVLQHRVAELEERVDFAERLLAQSGAGAARPGRREGKMDFESIVKIIVVAITVVGIPVAAYAAIVATRALGEAWPAGRQGRGARSGSGGTCSRLNEVEAQRTISRSSRNDSILPSGCWPVSRA